MDTPEPDPRPSENLRSGGDGATAPLIVGIGGGIDELTRGFPDSFVVALILSGLVGALSLGALVLGVGIWAPLVRRRRP